LAAPAVELVRWAVSVGVTDPVAAAAEHERVLGRRRPYERVSLHPIATAGAGEGLIVEGLTRQGGELAGVVFAVFLQSPHAYVLGFFCGPAEVQQAQERFLKPVLDSLRLPGGVAPPPRTPDLVPPAGPSPAAIGAPVVDPAGFSLTKPPGWQVGVSDGAATVRSPRGVVIVLMPLACGDGVWGRAMVESLIVRCCLAAGVEPSQAATALGSEAGAQWFSVSQADQAALFGLTAADGRALLAGVVAPPDELRAAIPQAAEVIASCKGWFGLSPSTQASPPAVGWRDPSAVLVSAAREGWTLRGGAVMYDQQPAVALRGSTDSGAWFAWLQPLRPVFRELTPAMRALGFHDGDPYYAYDGVDPRVVLERGPADSLLSRYLLPQRLLPTDAPLAVGAAASVDDLRLLDDPAQTTQLVPLARPGERGWCLLAQGATPGARGDHFWEAALLGFGGPVGEELRAARALQHVVQTATVGDTAAPETRAVLGPILATAQEALRSAAWSGVAGEVSYVPLLGRWDGLAPVSAPPWTAEAWGALARGQLQVYNDVSEAPVDSATADP
jgi:hypothetical protein